MKRAMEIRLMMRDVFKKEIDEIEKAIVEKASLGGTSITLDTLSNNAKEELENYGYSVIEARRFNEGGYIISWDQ